MGLFDNLKQQAERKVAGAAGNAAANMVGKAVNAATGKDQRWNIVLPSMPENLAQLQAMPGADLKDPAQVAALTVVALCVYPVNKDACIEMLNYLKGPKPLTAYEIQFLRDRFMDGKDYVPRSYLAGTSPQNNYIPTEPYTVAVHENPYSRDNEGYLVLWLKSSGADSERQITLRNKPSTGEWFLWDQMLLGDIRIPVAADPWA